MDRPKNLYVSENKILQHSITLMRDKGCPEAQFRFLVNQISVFLTYEAVAAIDVPSKRARTETPTGTKYEGCFIDSTEYGLVAIMRSGQTMGSSAHPYFPNAQIGHIGFRQADGSDTLKPFYKSIPNLSDKFCFVFDTDIVTGKSVTSAISYMVEKKGASPKKMAVISIITTQPGFERLEKHFNVPVFTAAFDERVGKNRSAYPGVGNFQERMFGFITPDKEKFGE